MLIPTVLWRPFRPSILMMAMCMVCTAYGFGNPAMAREGDLSAAIDVSADRSEYDEKAGIQILDGNVEIRQGSMKITADRVAISLQNNALSKIDGSGSPIRFEQENDAGEQLVGEAREISYNALEGTLVLSGAATLSQPRQTLKSNRIAFDARSQKVSAEGGGDTGRVNIRIQPPEPKKP